MFRDYARGYSILMDMLEFPCNNSSPIKKMNIPGEYFLRISIVFTFREQSEIF